jgi:hypothetical protein
MSNCIIQIKIGDQVITLDPNSNISPGNSEFLVNSIDVNKLRVLYSNLKESVNFNNVLSADKDLAKQGEILYSSVASLAAEKGEFISPAGALKSETNPDHKKVLAAYLNSLNGNEILRGGNFLLDMKDAYKLSPFTRDDIRNLLFTGSRRNELGLFNQLSNIPGMETLRMSIAVADNINGTRIDSPRGVYIRPDNIIQLLVPDDPKYYVHGVNDESGIAKASLTKAALREVRSTMLHELTHAVYSEVFISNPSFREAINGLHQRFTKYLSETNQTPEADVRNVYSDVHEFLSDMFVNKKLQQALNEIISSDRVYESLGRGNLYSFLIQTLPVDYRKSDSMLKDAISVMSDAIPKGDITDTLEKQLRDYIDPTDKRNLFFANDLPQDDIDSHTSPNDPYDSYWTVNAKAYRMQKAYLDRTEFSKEKNDFTQKDVYYAAPIDKPTQAQIDRLYANDLVLIPWLRYDKTDGKGRWVEQGVLTKDGKPIMDNGKFKIVDIIRKDGKIVQNYKDGVIEERFRHVPVMYSNMKKGTVVVAKVGLDPKAAESTYAGFNSISIPYNLIRGIRKYNWDFFDHNHDYTQDLAEAKDNLARSNSDRSGIESKFDRTSVFQIQVERAEANILKAAKVKQELVDLYNKYTYSRVEEDSDGVKTYHKNVTEDNYVNSGFTKKNVGSSVFANADDAIFTISKRGKDEIAQPNPAKFEILWQDDSGKAFAKTSASIAEAVTQGDLIRIHSTEKVDKDGESVTVNKYDWLPVYQKVANGVLVATKTGKGLIVSFNNIDAYAKNTTTEAWTNLMLRQKDAIDSMEDEMYLPKQDGDKWAKTNPEKVKFRPLRFNPDYSDGYEDTNEDNALTRFTKNKEQYTLPLIKPNESFVKVARKFKPFDPTEKKVVQYQSLEMVLAKSDAGLTTLRITNGGLYKIDHVRFSDKLEDHEHYGKELLFLLEDVSKVKEHWDAYVAEKKLFEENKELDSFTNEGTADKPKWKANFDFRDKPRNIRDWYDFYDNVNGVTVNRLKEGDVIAIKIDNSENPDLPSHYFRKVMRVLDDGRVAVADYRRQAVEYKGKTIGKEGYYARYVDMKDIAKVGYRVGKVEADGDSFVNDYHQDIIDRRRKLMEYASRDLDYNDFKFFTAESAAKWNNSKFPTSGKHKRVVPLTNRILDPKTTEPEVFLDRNLDAVTSAKDAAWVRAWFNGDSLSNVERGIGANSTYLKAEDIFVKNEKGYRQLKQLLYDNLMPGDWVVKTYTDKNGKTRQWASLIDRIEGKNIYTVNSDYSTSLVNFEKVSAIRTSVRNDRFKGNYDRYKRSEELTKALKKASTKTKPSLDLDFKSPKDSRRALYEIGNRLQQLNPDIKLNYVEQGDVNLILKQTGHDYSSVRAFVKDGEVFINTDKASISDVVHEYGHIFLHTLKYDNPELYSNIVASAKTHPLYDTIARRYSHLNQESDVNEEVFVTLLGEYMKGSLDSKSKEKMDSNKEVVVEFSKYTKEKLDEVLSGKEGHISQTDPAEILNMRLEDVIDMVGDHIMNNRISSIDDQPTLQFGKDVESLVADLKARGILTEECYG